MAINGLLTGLFDIRLSGGRERARVAVPSGRLGLGNASVHAEARRFKMEPQHSPLGSNRTLWLLVEEEDLA